MNNKILLVVGIPITLGLILFAFSGSLFNSSNNNSPKTQEQNTVIAQKPVFTKVLNLDPQVTYDNIIPPVDYDTRGYDGVGKQYPPANVANKCLFYFSHVRNTTAWEYGVYTAEWLQAHSATSTDFITFENDFAWPPYNLTAGWKSSVAQASASDCFIKAYSYTNETSFLILAKKSLMFLQVPVDQGGVMIDEGDGKWWYEGYASQDVKPPQVLISHQSTLLSLANYLAIEKDPTVQKLFDNGLNALKADAPVYDTGNNTSSFDRLENPAGSSHQTHITNFQRLYDITKDERILEIKKSFEE